MYILAPKNLQVGDILKSGINAEPKLGHSLPLEKIPIGSFIYNISLKIKKEGKIARSAGTFAKLIEKNSGFSLIKMNSGENKFIPIDCFASIGIVSNPFYCLRAIGKAGRSRWLNRRPIVRGVAMNPVDHPHGGRTKTNKPEKITTANALYINSIAIVRLLRETSFFPLIVPITAIIITIKVLVLIPPPVEADDAPMNI